MTVLYAKNRTVFSFSPLSKKVLVFHDMENEDFRYGKTARASIPVEIHLVRPFDRHPDVFRLRRREPGQMHSDPL